MIRFLFAATLAIASVAAILFAAKWHTPRPVLETNVVTRKVPYQVARMVPETITENGEEKTVYRPVYETNYKEIHETVSKEHPPRTLDTLRFWCISGVAGVFFLYALFVLSLWMRDKIKRGRENKDQKDTEQRLDTLMKFASGVLLGFLTAGGPASDSGSTPNVSNEHEYSTVEEAALVRQVTIEWPRGVCI